MPRVSSSPSKPVPGGRPVQTVGPCRGQGGRIESQNGAIGGAVPQDRWQRVLPVFSLPSFPRALPDALYTVGREPDDRSCGATKVTNRRKIRVNRVEALINNAVLA